MWVVPGEGCECAEKVASSLCDDPVIYCFHSRTDCIVLLPTPWLLVKLLTGVRQQAGFLFTPRHLCIPHAIFRFIGVCVGFVLFKRSM